MLLERHLALGKRPGLVAAQNVDAPEILHRGEVLNDHLLASHVNRALTQCNSRNHGQVFRRQSHSQRDRENQRLKKVALKDDADQQYEKHKQNRRFHDQETKLASAALELSFRWFA